MRPTKRAPDAGDSAHISSSFLRLSIFPVGRLRRPHPSAGPRKPLGGWRRIIYNKYNKGLICDYVGDKLNSLG